MRRMLRTLSCVLLATALTGCATITRGTKEVLVVESEPTGADVRLSTGLTGKTPASFKVGRRGGFVVTIEKEGYETVQVQVESQIAGAGAAGMAGNVILGGLIGAAIDAGSGSMLELKPNPITVRLVPLDLKTTAIPAKAETPLEPTSIPEEDAEVEVEGIVSSTATEDLSLQEYRDLIPFGTPAEKVKTLLGKPERTFDFSGGADWFYPERGIRVTIFEGTSVEVRALE